MGYGGTKKEMERLLADAQKLTGVKYDISSLDDVINAIHAIQDEIGITGTTADEAKKTIEGSANAVKAAWENLLTAMADPNGGHDLQQMVKDFVDTATTSIDNMMPSIEAAILGMGDVIEDLAPVIEEKLPQLIDDIIPPLTEAITALMGAAGQAIIDNLPTILDGIWDALRQILDETDGTARAVVTIITGTWAALKGIGIATDIAHIVTLIGGSQGVVGVLNVLNGTLGGTAAAATTASTGFAALAASIAPLLAIGAALTAGAIALSNYIDEEREALNEYADGLNGYTDIENERLERYVRLTQSSTKEAAEAAKEWYESDKEMYDAMADMRQKYLDEGGEVGDAMDQYYTEQINSLGRLVLQEEKAIEKGEELLTEEKASADAEFAAAHTREAARQQEIASMAEMAKSGNTNADIISDIYKRRAEELDSTLSDLDSRLAKHRLTEDEYWEKRLKAVERYRNEDDEKWWGYYDKIKDHYDKQAKADADAAKEAKQKRLQAMKEEEAQTKADLEDYFREIETQALDVDKEQRDKWIVDRKLEYIDRLDHESDLYKDYYLKLSNEKESIRDKQDAKDENDAKAKAEAKKKRLEQRQSETQKLIKEGMEAASKLEAEYESRMQSIVNAVNSPEKVTDANGNERLIFTDFGKKLREIRKYQENLGKLEGLGLSEQHLKDIFSMDLDTRMKYVDELLKMTDSNRQRYLTDYEDYYKAARVTAETETDLSGKDDEILNEGIDKALDDIADNSYIKGKEAREAWLQGWKEGGGAFYEDMTPALKSIDSTDPTRQTVTAALSGMMQGRMVINIAGTEVINKSFKDILDAMKNSGGILDV